MPESAEIAAIVLAAGTSTRFGADKLLHPLTLGGYSGPLLAHSLRPWLKVFRQVCVVTRPDADNLKTAVGNALTAAESDQLCWISCAQASQGMAFSLACGVTAKRAASGWLIGLGDMPRLPEAAILAVHDAIATGHRLAAAFHGARRGHPVGFHRDYFAALTTLQGDQGARDLLQRDHSQLMRIMINHDGIFCDVDCQSDLSGLA